MRRAQKEQLPDLLKTFYQAHDVIKEYVSNGEIENAGRLLTECQETAIQLGTMIEQWEGEGFVTVGLLEEYCEILFQAYEGLDANRTDNRVNKLLNKKLIQVENSVKSDIKARLEIVFMPYKASMWDSLESIWMAAHRDPGCDAYVIPIPYYDRNPDYSFGKKHYEGAEYPEYVPVVDYKSYPLEKRRPDIIYIHSPYDDCNFVTSIDPRFYSKELKKYTDMLVYVSYFISGYYASIGSIKKYITSCFFYSDKIILQSDKQKELYTANGVPQTRLAVLGNPKTDFIKNSLSSVKIPEEWMREAKGKTVFLVNTTISRILKDIRWAKCMNELIDLFEDWEDIILLWRPHPLIHSTIEAMRPDKISEYDSILSRMYKSKQVIVDQSNYAYAAIKLSDAMISDYSSLVMQYSLTGKPVLLTAGHRNYRNTKEVCFDYFSNYFVEDGTTEADFIKMVKSNSDEYKEERLADISKSIVNADGSCGDKIHHYICSITEGW